MQSVCIVGLGYVGLPTAIVAAKNGYNVIGFDINTQRVDDINQGIVASTEPNFHEKLTHAITHNSFVATTRIQHAHYYIVAVPTPLKDDTHADLHYVQSAIDTIIPVITPGDTIIIESTIPVGTTEYLAQYLEKNTPYTIGHDIFLAHCPERIWPNNVFYELIHNDRIIGGITNACTQKAAQFYQPFVKGTLYLKSARFAELLKLIENSAIDVSVALAHQVALLAEQCSFDPYEVIDIANKHPRVRILNPTCGVGGHCVAVDPWFLITTFPQHTNLLHAARTINDERPFHVINAIKKAVATWHTQHHQQTCHIHLLGIAYKPNTEDTRQSPALQVAHTLCSETSITVTVSDPCIAHKTMYTLFGAQAVEYHEGIQRADIVAFLVGHKEFEHIPQHVLTSKTILDFTGIQFNLHKISKTNPQKNTLL
jgi:UDP-N-acetyl-D-mannosaminuronic acid dehydrogenase